MTACEVAYIIKNTFIDVVDELNYDTPDWECQSCPGRLDYAEDVEMDASEEHPLWVTFCYDTVIFANCYSAKQKSLGHKGDVLLVEAGVYKCAGLWMRRLVDGGAILGDDCRMALDSEKSLNPDLVVYEVGARLRPRKRFGKYGCRPTSCFSGVSRDEYVEMHASFRKRLHQRFYQYGYISLKEEADVGPIRYSNTCLIDAFRICGVPVPYTSSGPFWALRDGNRFLQEFGMFLERA